ncbi:glutaredoxin family protein [Enterococcus raffinosus]|uniref:glutaredoxin family protein n=1 Tax=Enterococcus raffinosus TaxID=71452 RepID=UPI00288E2A52|nr:glutaredoxin family protein [Enterococcus raffinosus]MDT2522442.1 glutaredoxin family protein [Enterococcus raffinosus]MDT2533641.1 glutaredoxin family protein [Enterococcus raffinosus]MDT2591178.1 glutaredoxin family protein [Enterococcus raffinosus]
MSKYQLTVYTRPFCLDCQKLKRDLSQKEIPYKLIEVNSSEEEEQMVNVTGSKIVPALIFMKKGLLKKKTIFIGYEANQIEINKYLQS